jgi:hypothetical protein
MSHGYGRPVGPKYADTPAEWYSVSGANSFALHSSANTVGLP